MCIHGHYVCNECHIAGIDTIISLCLTETSKKPVKRIEKMMSLPFYHLQVHTPDLGIICNHSAQNNQCIGKRCPFTKHQ